jgi:predicted transcriptional regulator
VTLAANTWAYEWGQCQPKEIGLDGGMAYRKLTAPSHCLPSRWHSRHRLREAVERQLRQRAHHRAACSDAVAGRFGGTSELIPAVVDTVQTVPEGSAQRRQRLYPVLSDDGRLVGVLPWSAVLAGKDQPNGVGDAMIAPTAIAYPDEILRSVADRMAALGLGVIPVVDRDDTGHLDGLITQFDLLAARQKLLEEERHAERVLRLRRVTARPAEDTAATDNPDEAGE